MGKRSVLTILCLLALGTFGRAVAAQELQPATVSIDTTNRGEPISPYIFGQFIEHLGRCIYGGIWAEMLEDRKFYYPITLEYDPYVKVGGMAEDPIVPVVGRSPWEMIGRKQVVMVAEDAFVGEHSPLIGPGSGIRHNDLGILAGKKYEGYIWLKSKEKPARVTVKLTGAKGTAVFENIPREYTKYSFSFEAVENTNKASLEIHVEGGPCFVGCVSLMPADNIEGMRADTIALLKQLAAPIYRWPGGNFVSGYDWRDGIGPRDRRPPRKNPAWAGVEPNDFGIDEFITFCRIVGAEPLVAVNTGFGDAYSAAQLVEYCNGSTDTIAGRWRAENGHPEPYNVKWWCVGNEMYGPWQLGFMQSHHYVLKHNLVVDYMRRVDPSIKIIGVGALGHFNPRHDPGQRVGWSKLMLMNCADHMDLISEHFYCGSKENLLEHVRQLRDQVRRKAEGHRRLREELPNLKGKDIRIAMDEWNYWTRPYYYGELGCIYRMRDALGVAMALHEYFRNTDIIYMANYAQTVNVIGCIKTTKTHAAFAATGLPLMMYRHYFGKIPVQTTAPEPLDVMAALSEDGQTLTVGVVNPTEQPASLKLELKGSELSGSAKQWQIAADPTAYNKPGEKPQIAVRSAERQVSNNTLTVPAYSVTIFALELK